MFNIGTAVKQSGNNLRSSLRIKSNEITSKLTTNLKAGQCQSRILVGFNLSIDISTAVKQKGNSLKMTVHGSQHQRRNSELNKILKTKRQKGSKGTFEAVRELISAPASSKIFIISM